MCQFNLVIRSICIPGNTKMPFSVSSLHCYCLAGGNLARQRPIDLHYENLPMQYIGFVSEETNEKVQVGKDQEKAQSEKDSHSKNRGGKKPN